MTNSLKKPYILSRKKEISVLYGTGVRWKGSCIRIIFTKNSYFHDRIAILVSKRNGNAVERNRIKRIFRELFRTHKRINPPFFDVLVQPERNCLEYLEQTKSVFLSWLTELEKN